ncbi:MAG TPA: hypothetical protein VHM48_01085 [Candidatus Limnocylindrales bacterium]|nr:hypothetical protein [Candidatus Limnocylindrales bacterium]
MDTEEMALGDDVPHAPERGPDIANRRSRRAVLAGAFGAVVGAAVGRLAQPPSVRAATGDPVLAGQANTANTETDLTSTDVNYSNAVLNVSGITGRTIAAVNTATSPDGIGGNGVVGTSSVGFGVVGSGGRGGVIGSSFLGPGIWGTASYDSPAVLGEISGPSSRPAVFGHATNNGLGSNAAGPGVYGVSRPSSTDHPTPPVNTGVAGWSFAGTGARGDSDTGVGTSAQTTGGNLAAQAFTGAGDPPTPAPIAYAIPTATYGEANGTNGTGVWGYSAASTGTGVYGESSIGVWGFGGWGVFGASDATGTGVYGFSGSTVPAAPAHTGVFGYSDSGYGVYARALTGTALYVNGKARFSRSGVISITSGHRSITKTLSGVTASSMIIAMAQNLVTGVFVQAAIPGSGKFTIYLNKTVTATTKVAWFVIN